MAIHGLIRQARPADADAIVRIYSPLVTDSAISFEIEPPSTTEMKTRMSSIATTDPWLVLESAGEIAGYAYASDFRHRPSYASTRETTVYVHPDHHRRGVGRTLMMALLSEIAARGAHLAVAVIALPNDASIRLHESLGFSHVGTFHEVARKFDRWHDEGHWTRRLD